MSVVHTGSFTVSGTIPPTPSVGRIVHYVPLSDAPAPFSKAGGDLGGEPPPTPPSGHWAAIITAVTPQGYSHVWLTVFPPGAEPMAFKHAVRYSADASFEGTWHWPEFVG